MTTYEVTKERTIQNKKYHNLMLKAVARNKKKKNYFF